MDDSWATQTAKELQSTPSWLQGGLQARQTSNETPDDEKETVGVHFGKTWSHTEEAASQSTQPRAAPKRCTSFIPDEPIKDRLSGRSRTSQTKRPSLIQEGLSSMEV